MSPYKRSAVHATDSLDANKIHALLNTAAYSCFRNTADGDYISARSSFQLGLWQQFLSSSLQALEKYLKCILLLERAVEKNLSHNLGSALEAVRRNIPQFTVSDSTKSVIARLDSTNFDRYLEFSYVMKGGEMFSLDQAVWEIRQYCGLWNCPIQESSPESAALLRDGDLERIKNRIESSWNVGSAPDRMPSQQGFLELVEETRDHPARKTFLYRNLFFGLRKRRTVPAVFRFHATNAPLFMYPELAKLLDHYVYLSSAARKEYGLPERFRKPYRPPDDVGSAP